MPIEIVEVRITGLAELQEKLNRLPPEFSRKALKTGLRPAGNVFRRAIQSLAPRLTGWLASQVTLRVKTNNLDEGSATVSFSRKQNPARIGKAKHVPSAIQEALWNEFGVPAHGIAARPFIRPAYETSKNSVIDTFVSNLRDALTDTFK